MKRLIQKQYLTTIDKAGLVNGHLMWKGYVTIGAAIFMVAFLISVALITSPAPPVKFAVLDYSDPNAVGRVTSMSIGVTSRSSQPIRPRFSVQWGSYPFYWRVKSGPPVLNPGTEAVYVIESPSPRESPPTGAEFILRVNDAEGSSFVVSDPLTADLVVPPIINSSLSFWEFGPVSEHPWGWQANINGKGSVTHARIDGILATQLLVDQTGEAAWFEAYILQEGISGCDFIQATIHRLTDFRTTDAGWPELAFGMEVRDEERPSRNFIWFVFSQDAVPNYALGNGHHIVPVPGPKNEWVSIAVPITAAFESFGLPAPERISLKFFIAAHESQIRTFSSFVERVECSDAGQRVN